MTFPFHNALATLRTFRCCRPPEQRRCVVQRLGRAALFPGRADDGGMSGAAVGSPNRKFSRGCLDQRPGVAHAGEVHGEGAVLHDPPDPPLEGSTLIVVQQFGQVCRHFVR